MILTLKEGFTDEQYESLIKRIKDTGLEPNIDRGASKRLLDLRGETRDIETGYFMVDGVESITGGFKKIQACFKGVPSFKLCC